MIQIKLKLQIQNNESVEFSTTAVWVELIFGLKAELFNNLFLGFNVQLKAKFLKNYLIISRIYIFQVLDEHMTAAKLEQGLVIAYHTYYLFIKKTE